MQRHCEIGYRIAQSAPELVPIGEWILKHHEWWEVKLVITAAIKKAVTPSRCVAAY